MKLEVLPAYKQPGTGLELINRIPIGEPGISEQGYPFHTIRGEATSPALAAMFAAAPALIAAMSEIIKTCEAGVIQRSETGKPQWNALDHMKAIASAAIAACNQVHIAPPVVPDNPKMEGQHVRRSKDGKTIFVQIPAHLAKVIDAGCGCEHCKANPGIAPKWDALAISSTAPKGRADYAFTVHAPTLMTSNAYAQV